MADSKVVTSLKEATKEHRCNFLERICEQMYCATKKSSTKKLPWGYVSSILKESKTEEPWLTKNRINFAFKKFCVNKSQETETVLEEDSTIINSCTRNGGRPKGTTIIKKQHYKETYIAAKNEITSLFKKEQEKCKKQGETLPNGWLKSTIERVSSKRGLPPGTKIPLSTIRSRKQAVVLTEHGPTTPMHQVEPHLVTLILAMAQARRCMGASECLALANDLIRGTEVEKQIIESKKKRNEWKDNNSPILGKKYWKLFTRRWNHQLVSRRGQKFAIERSNSLTYHNVKKMYNDVYAALVESGNATKLEDASSDYSGPFKTHYVLTHPENCVVVDEVGSDTSQKGDGHIGGAKYYCARGWIPQNQASSNDKHFTVLGFTALNGKPVMCLVVIAGVHEKFEVECGINPDATEVGSRSDPDFFSKNQGKGKLFPMGPECTYNGKRVPTMVRWSPSGSITSIILRDALATMDHLGLFVRSSSRRPFLLLDGHGSRFELPFLEYITNTDHPWMVCIGVPYGTSLWQVADSKEQNGSFKIGLSKAKKRIVEKRLDMHMDSPGVCATDIMTIIDEAWSQSFARIDLNLKAIEARGWGPLNYNLLNDEDIKATMTDDEAREYRQMLKKELPTQVTIEETSATIGVKPSSSFVASTSMISDLTDDNKTHTSKKNLNYDQQYYSKVISNSVTLNSKLNFSTGRAADVARRLLHDHDIRQAREENRKLADKGKEARDKLLQVKKLSAMLNFNYIGCKVGEDSLKVRLEIARKKKESDEQLQQKKDKVTNDRKRKFDNLLNEILNKNLPYSELSLAQLKLLCQHKKRKDDKVSISKLKRDELLQLWMIWKDRSDEHEIEAALKKVKTNHDASETRISTGRSSSTDDTVMTYDNDSNNEINCNENTIHHNFVDI